MLIYRTLLRLYPRPFRGRYGAEMMRAFADRRRAAAAQGLIPLAACHAGALRDLMANAIAERLETRRRRGSRASLTSLVHDLRNAVRMLRREPGLTALTAATLALGIGS